VSASGRFLKPSEAARRLGVSAKALRLYEERGLVAPTRTAAGWRAYGPVQMERAAEIAALRTLGFSLAQVERVLSGDAQGLEPALAAHQARLEQQIGQLGATVERVRSLRGDLAQGKAPTATDLARLAGPTPEPIVAFDLPWPWGGERFELREVRALNFIIGPLGCGKTRLAQRLAETLPGAAFLGLDRAAPAGRLDPRAEQALAWVVEDGATASDALIALLASLEADGPAMLVIDLIEQGLDEATQQAVIAHLRRRGPAGRPLFIMTRSSAILDLAAVGPDETLILCPANHSPPTMVAPYPGAPGYEAVATCLAPPDVRARTEGMRSWRPAVA
jgi:DNA-binding transcriptional MerR regulator